MDSINIIANKNTSCGSLASANTGTLGCQIEFGALAHALFPRKGLIIPKETVFDKTYIDAQTQLGNFVPVLSADSFEELSSEDTMYTNPKGVERLSILALPKYRLTYQQGHGFYREIAKLTSFKNFDVILGDEEGNWKLAMNANGDFTGFTAGQILAEMTKTKVQGGDPESKGLVFQLLNRTQWDKDYAIFGREQLNFSPEDLATVNPVEINVDVALDAATALTFEMLLSSDRTTPVEGLTGANIRVWKNNVPVVGPFVVTEPEPGKYSVTVAAVATSEKYKIETYDSTLITRNTLLSDTLFNGVSNEITV